MVLQQRTVIFIPFSFAWNSYSNKKPAKKSRDIATFSVWRGKAKRRKFMVLIYI